MKSVDAHLDDCLDGVDPLEPIDLQLLDAHGCILAEEVVAPWAIPGFDNASHDGYAVRAADLADASEGHEVDLPVMGDIPAGRPATVALRPGTTMRIMTGAPVPEGADAVVPVEWTDAGIANVKIGRAPELGAHIRRTGSDVVAGQQVLAAGARLGPAQLGLLAAVGRDRVVARPKPRVVVLSTGSELVDPGLPLQPGQISESNSFALTAAAREAGALAYRVGIVLDDPRKLMDTLEDQLIRADLIVTTGGVSAGAYDVVKEVLSRLGTVSFEKVAMQPGMPQGRGSIGPEETPDLHAAGQPGQRLRLVRGVRPAGDPAHARRRAAAPADRPRRLHRGVPLARRQAPVRSRLALRRGGPLRRTPGRRSGLAPGQRPGPRQLPDRRTRGRDRGRRRRHRHRDGAGAAAVMTAGGGFTHLDSSGAARMVDVSGKEISVRTARATGRVLVSAEVVALLRGGGVPKGDAIAVARIAGIQAAKRTPDLVPLCHPIAIHGVDVDLVVARRPRRDHRDRAYGRPHRRRDGGADLRRRRRPRPRRHGQGRRPGGRHHRRTRRGEDRRQDRTLGQGRRLMRALVVTSSNRAAAGVYPDRSGPVVVDGLRELGFDVDGPEVVADGEPVETALRSAVAAGYDVVVTTGGTGLTPADLTPEMTRRVVDREIPGVAEAIRAYGTAAGVPTAALSRGLAGLAGRTLVINLPGSTGGVRDGLAVLGPLLAHAVEQVAGGDH